MATPSANYTALGTNFSIPASETEQTDITAFLINALAALEGHTHNGTDRGALVAAGAAVAAAGTLTGATLAAGVLASSLTSVGTLASLTVTGLVTANGGLTVASGQTLTLTGVTIVGLSGITAAAGTLTGATLAAGVLASSLTSVGTLSALSLSGTLTMTAAASKIVPGATSFSHRNTADSADNVLISDAGLVTARLGVTLTAGALTFGAASSKIVPGATNFAVRNTADSANNLLVSNGGDVTVRTSLIVSSGSASTLERTDSAGTLGFINWNRGGANKFILGTDAADSWVIYNAAIAQLLTLGSAGLLTLGTPAARSVTQPTLALNIFNGTAPAGTLTNGVTLYATAGEAYIMDAGGTATLQSPHDDDGNWVFSDHDTVTGERLTIDVEKLLRFLNDHHGLDFVHDSQEVV